MIETVIGVAAVLFLLGLAIVKSTRTRMHDIDSTDWIALLRLAKQRDQQAAETLDKSPEM